MEGARAPVGGGVNVAAMGQRLAEAWGVIANAVERVRLSFGAMASNANDGRRHVYRMGRKPRGIPVPVWLASAPVQERAYDAPAAKRPTMRARQAGVRERAPQRRKIRAWER